MTTPVEVPQLKISPRYARAITATAAQRAEAFLRTIGKREGTQ